MKRVERAAAAIAWAAFFLALDVLLKVFRESDSSKDDPGVDLRALLGVVRPREKD